MNPVGNLLRTNFSAPSSTKEIQNTDEQADAKEYNEGSRYDRTNQQSYRWQNKKITNKTDGRRPENQTREPVDNPLRQKLIESNKSNQKPHGDKERPLPARQ